MISSNIINGFDAISLSELDSLSLMNRVDTKYILHLNQLPLLLKLVEGKYNILQINGNYLMQYHTTYFDTADMFFYLCHHNGRLNRYKVRFRDYMETGQTFFEIKKKINGNRTRKVRKAVEWQSKEITETEMAFFAKHSKMSGLELQPSIENYFQRITLASQQTLERVTIDMGIQYMHGSKMVNYPDIVVAEIKRGGESSGSPMAAALKQIGIRSCGFSKYCVGIVSLYSNIKYNRFKPKLLILNKIQHGGNN